MKNYSEGVVKNTENYQDYRRKKMGWIEKTSFRTIDISVDNQGNLYTKLEEILNRWDTKQIISVNPTIPDITDSLHWYEVYYEFYI